MLGAASLFVCLALAATMLILEKARPELMQSVRAEMSDVIRPVATLFSAPQQAWQHASDKISGFFGTYEENKRLKLEREELLKWQTLAHEYARENEQLRGLLQVVPDGKPFYITARMVGSFGHGASHMALLSAGKENGVKENLAVVSPEGLVGRIVEVGDSSSRVLLLRDINANIPVVTETGGYKAILTGSQNNADLKLMLGEKLSQMQVGDRLVTSGDGGMIPPGIPVAMVTSVAGEKVIARPLADLDHASLVTIIDFEL